MTKVLGLIAIIGITIMVCLLCFFSCILSKWADQYWEEFKKGKDKDGRD